jgi:hypothetical protein
MRTKHTINDKPVAVGIEPLDTMQNIACVFVPDAGFRDISQIALVWSGGKLTQEQRKQVKMPLFYMTCLLSKKTGMQSYLDHEWIEQNHPEWFLYTDSTNKERIYSPEWKSNFLDVGNPEFQDYAVAEFVKRSAGYAGIGADTVMLRTFADARTKQYPNWKYAKGGWNQGYYALLRKLKAALNRQGKILIANHTLYYVNDTDTDWPDLMASVNGLMSEEAVLKWSKATLIHTDRFGGAEWECSMRRHETILTAGLYDFWEINLLGRVTEDIEYQNFLYSYCSFLLIREARSLFGVRKFYGGKELEVDYPELTAPIGNPISKRIKTGHMSYRDYEFGSVWVNTKDLTAGIEVNK